MQRRHIVLVALVGVALFAVLGRSAQSQTAFPALSARSSLPAAAASSKIAFISAPLRCRGCGGAGALTVMNADGSAQRVLARNVWDLAWSPNGPRIVFVRGGLYPRLGNPTIYVVNADGSGARRLSSGSGPAWSPDGQKIVLTRGRGMVYVMNADGSGQRKLTQAAKDTFPLWLPDGRIAFINFSGPVEVHVMNADGTGQRNPTREWGLDGWPAWSPDGRTIAFPSARDGNWEIYVMNADGSGQRRLTRRGSEPLWSPDGRKIAFLSARDGTTELYIMNADGSGQRG